MAGQTLNVNSTLQCPHGGTVQIVSTNTQVKAHQGFAATQGDTFVVTGCPYQIPGTPPIPSPCVRVQWIVADVSVKVNGVASLSSGSTGICLSAAQLPQGPVSVVAAQARVNSQ